MKYKKATVSDLICDEYFQNWIFKPDDKISDFWNNWLDANPDKRETVSQARRVLLNLKFKEDIPDTEQIQNALKRNLLKLDSLTVKKEIKPKVIPINRIRNLARIAAVFIGVAIIGAILYSNWKSEKIIVATNYGEIKNVVLPDGSEIILNAHSSISYLKHWSSSEIRKVQLQGEAFFKVKHLNKNKHEIKKSERFIVSTNDLNVEVLGTTFDVKNRHDQTIVVLKTGKINVAFKNKKQTDITMVPGEMIAYETLTNQLRRSVTDPVVQTAWVDKKLILDNASINTIIQYIEDNYGYKVILKDTTIGNKKMEGTLMLDNLPDVLFVLSTSLDIRIEKKDSTLIFTKMIKDP